MAEGYTHDDTMYQKITKIGGGIKVGNVIEQENGQKYHLVQCVDIDWNDAKLPYTYNVIGSYINDTTDLLNLIDDISHGNAIDWEVYQGEPSNGNS